ncbi:hypothetical protein SERLA73DRAFT_177850 [Serpula lacrymans var. lacrymans S7.3]|uniref:Uncharacterized protein n=2 Tax=Serpula lacrymans var. lacrymans TaxID=341189 RepID=F8PPP7_SERL3|nr:uncharacterized protein SERLADRAFT_461664 [Serpula lacrymans var. lacrymans S7.9]EGO02105.1 hypothetical protein SERLA73DRAFT_177850 [Serpula lacrymans var. lacrymans S7.3]EGO27728.1 hypothetical protein SERLADRAFT_461664 [Serpula lacrymans var. lacrymans S7.9]
MHYVDNDSGEWDLSAVHQVINPTVAAKNPPITLSQIRRRLVVEIMQNDPHLPPPQYPLMITSMHSPSSAIKRPCTTSGQMVTKPIVAKVIAQMGKPILIMEDT